MNEMICRTRWQPGNQQDDIQCGVLVVLKEDNLPLLAWKLGQIVQIFPDHDKVVPIKSSSPAITGTKECN